MTVSMAGERGGAVRHVQPACVPARDVREEVNDLLRTALGRNARLRRPARTAQHPMTASSHAQLEGRTAP